MKQRRFMTTIMAIILVFFFLLSIVVGCSVWTIQKSTLNKLSLGGIILMGKTLTEWGIGDVPLIELYQSFTSIMRQRAREDFVDPLKIPLPQHEENVIEKLQNSTVAPSGTVFFRELYDHGAFFERQFELAFNTHELTTLLNLVVNSSTTDALVCAFKDYNLKWESLSFRVTEESILLDQVLSVRLTETAKNHFNSIPTMSVPDVFYITSTAMLGVSQSGRMMQFPKGGANIAADQVTKIAVNDFSPEVTNMILNVFLFDLKDAFAAVTEDVVLTRTPENFFNFAITKIVVQTVNRLGIVGTMPNSVDTLPGENGVRDNEIRFITRRIADMLIEN